MRPPKNNGVRSMLDRAIKRTPFSGTLKGLGSSNSRFPPKSAIELNYFIYSFCAILFHMSKEDVDNSDFDHLMNIIPMSMDMFKYM